jgi:hypothetical protein
MFRDIVALILILAGLAVGVQAGREGHSQFDKDTLVFGCVIAVILVVAGWLLK